ncbi:hypothetical protein K3495_g13315 [Podosphaera aphanis]|nr:hypothetical protein K3495_g13315 [Podosphaera aphanis]
MILSEVHNELTRRAYGFCVRNGRYGSYPSCRQSLWRRIGRWILVSILLFISFSVISVTLCCIARRRMKQRRNFGNVPPMSTAPPSGYGGGHQPQYASQHNQHYQPGVAQPPNAHFR